MSGAIPSELLILTFWNEGGAALLNVGATMPSKLTVPVLLNPALRASVCGPVPVKVIVPPLVKVPELEKSPAKLQDVMPDPYVAERAIVPSTLMSLNPV